MLASHIIYIFHTVQNRCSLHQFKQVYRMYSRLKSNAKYSVKEWTFSWNPIYKVQFDEIFREFNFAQGVLVLRKVSLPLAARSKSADFIMLLDEDWRHITESIYLKFGVVKVGNLSWRLEKLVNMVNIGNFSWELKNWTG